MKLGAFGNVGLVTPGVGFGVAETDAPVFAALVFTALVPAALLLLLELQPAATSVMAASPRVRTTRNEPTARVRRFRSFTRPPLRPPWESTDATIRGESRRQLPLRSYVPGRLGP